MILHRKRGDSAVRPSPFLALAATLVVSFGGLVPARGDLIRPTAAQSFPDLDGDIAATQSYTYDPTSQSGTFQVNSAPTLLATGPNVSSEYTISDTPTAPRSETLQIKLDSSGHLIANDPGNTFSLYGSVTVNGQLYSGLLLQGTPTQFGYLAPQAGAPTMSVYDTNIALTGGLLKTIYGPDAYMRIITETNSTFAGSFNENFLGLKAMTNVRAYDALGLPAAIPEPGTFAVVAAFSAVGLFYRRRVTRR